jgi:hypothetical protein
MPGVDRNQTGRRRRLSGGVGESGVGAAAKKGKEQKKMGSLSEVVRKPFQNLTSNTMPRITGKDKLSDMYAQCLNLASQNKINKQNSWGLQLIDYIEDVLAQDQETLNFQKASCTLDASVKIYGYRVDSLYQDAFKILGGLSAGQAQRGGPGGEEEPELNDDGTEKKKKRARQQKEAVTIETKLANINIKQHDQQYEVDPLFQKTSAAIDAGGAEGMLLNTLGVTQLCTVAFDSATLVNRTPAAPAPAAESESVLVDVAGLRALVGKALQGNTVGEVRVSQAVRFFEQWGTDGAGEDPFHGQLDEEEAEADAGGEEEALDQFALGLAIDREAKTYDAEAEETAAANAAAAAVNAHDMDMDMDMDMDFGDDDVDGFDIPDDMGSLEHNPAEHAREQPEALGGADAVVSADEAGAASGLLSTYSALDKHWAGLAHWKFTKKARVTRSRSQQQQDGFGADEGSGGPRKASTRERKSKKVKYIDFLATLPASAVSKGRGNNCLTAATLSKAQAEASKYVLPVDLHFNPRRFQTLFCNPAMLVSLTSAASSSSSSSSSSSGVSSAPFEGDTPTGQPAHMLLLQGADALQASAEPFADASHAGKHMIGADGVESGAVDWNSAGAIDDAGGFGDEDGFGGFEDYGDLGEMDTEYLQGAPSAEGEAGTHELNEAGEFTMIEGVKRVNKINIGFARFAKPIDVSQLKRGLWAGIKAKPVLKESVQECSAEDKTSFNTLIQSATQAGKQAPSVAISFICMLHLANEKHLKLRPQQGTQDGAPDAWLGDFDVIRTEHD